MSLEALLTGYKGNGNPIQKLVNTFYSVDTAFHREINFLPETPEYRVSTKLDSTRELIEELRKLINKDTKQEVELGSLDLTGVNRTFDSLVGSDSEEEVFLQVLLDFGFEEAWSQSQQANSMIAEESAAEKLVNEFLAFEKEYNSLFAPLSPVSMETNSDNTSDDEKATSNKRQRTEKDAIAYANIFEAAENGDIQGVEYYLANGVKINAPDDFGDTVLHNAARNGHDSLIKHLLEHHHDLDINALDADNDSALMQAAIFNKEAIVRVLLEHKANPNICDVFGNTPVHVAAENSNLNILKLLKEYRADLKAINKSKWSVMHSAAVGITTKAEKWDMIKWLLENGVNPSSKDAKDVSVSDVFYRKDCSYLIHYEQLVGEIQPIEE